MATRWRSLLPRSVRDLPADLASVVFLTLLAVAFASIPGLDGTPLRVAFGLPLVLFLPGYALIAALFPEAGTGSGDGDEARDGIDGVERVALAFGTSIAVTSLLGVVLSFTPWGIRLAPILAAVGGFTLLVTVVAALRRRDIPADDRFSVPYRTWLASSRAELLEPGSRTDVALNVLLVASVLVAVVSVGYAVAVPTQGEAFTEFYLLTHRDNGTLVAANYPTQFTQGHAKPIVVGVGNHEHRAENYTMLVELQRVQTTNNTTTVLEQRRLQRFGTAVQANQTWRSTRSITPTMTGRHLRLAFLLYKGPPPTRPSVSSAYRETHLWVNVTAPSSG